MTAARSKAYTLAALALVVVAMAAWLLSEPPTAAPAAAAPTADGNAGVEAPSSTVVERPPAAAGPRPTTARAAVLEGRATIAGRVVTPAGAAVAGAAVHAAGDQRAVTAEDGSFELGGLLPGEHWLHAAAAGYAAVPAAPVRVEPEQRADDVILVLAPARALEGRVVSTAGPPIAAATITVRLLATTDDDGVPRVLDPDLPATWRGASDADGHFQVSGLPPGTVEVQVEHPDYLGFGQRRPTDAGPMQVRLQRVAGVHGRLHDEAGRPVVVERITLLVSRDEDLGPWLVLGEPRRVVGAPDGSFRMPVRTRRLCRVVVEGRVVEGRSCGRAVSAPFRTDGLFDHGPLVLQAPAGWPLAGRVVDDQGRPVAGARVAVQEPLGLVELVQTGAPLARAPVTTDAEGRFVTAPLAAGRYTVAVVADGCVRTVSASFEVPAGGAEAITVQAVRSGAIQGSLAGVRGSGLPQLEVTAEALVTAEGERAQPPARAPLRAARFTLDGLAPGRYRLLLRSASRAILTHGPTTLQTVEVEVRPRQVTEVALRADTLGQAEVHGTLWLRGAPAPRVEVQLRGGTPPLVWACATDRHGAFHFAAVPAGSYTVGAAATPASGALEPQAVEVGEQGSVRVDLR